MAYLVDTSPTLLTIPDTVVDFAVNTLGWTTDGAGLLRPPTMEGDLSYYVSASVTGSSTRSRERLIVALQREGERLGDNAVAPSPYISGAYQQPSRVFLHGGNTPEPYIAVAIEYEPGFFRHLYLGSLEKIGAYGGGEVWAGSHFQKDTTAGVSYTNSRQRYLFTGYTTNSPYTDAFGGVRLVEEGIETIPRFSTNSGITSTPSGRVFGGFNDNYNTFSLAAGRLPFAGAAMLSPINLLRTLEADRVQPIGRPAGVRMVNMESLDAGSVITAGGKTWRCYPAIKKGGSGNVGANLSDESSYNVGYAYLVD